MEYRLHWVPNAQFSRWSCTFHVVCAHCICVGQPTQTGFAVEYGLYSICCRAGLLPQKVALNITRFLANETNLVPWRTADLFFSFMYEILAQTEVYGSFKVRKQINITIIRNTE